MPGGIVSVLCNTSSLNKTLNSDKYFYLFAPIKEIDEKCPVLANRKGSLDLTCLFRLWDVLLYPLFFPEIVNSKYHLFRTTQFLLNSLHRKNLNSMEIYEKHLEEFTKQKDTKFWIAGIMNIP